MEGIPMNFNKPTFDFVLFNTGDIVGTSGSCTNDCKNFTCDNVCTKNACTNAINCPNNKYVD